MSDISQLMGFRYNQRDIIESVIDSRFFADYGIVDKDNGDGTVDVVHATLPVLIDGTVQNANKTSKVELLYPASASFGIKWPIAQGDGVLLIGLKDYVSTSKDIQQPTEAPQEFLHYVQNTMKAIPLQQVEAPKVFIEIDTNQNIKVKNDNGSFELKQNGQVSINNGNLTVDA